MICIDKNIKYIQCILKYKKYKINNKFFYLFIKKLISNILIIFLFLQVFQYNNSFQIILLYLYLTNLCMQSMHIYLELKFNNYFITTLFYNILKFQSLFHNH